MKDRLRQIIEYKTGGSQRAFCDALGWKPPYLSKLLKGDDFGIKPVMAVLRLCSEVDARWLLFGTGTMLTEDSLADAKRRLLENVSTILDLEKYMRVMTPEELKEFEKAVVEVRDFHADAHQVAEWEQRLKAKYKPLDGYEQQQ